MRTKGKLIVLASLLVYIVLLILLYFDRHITAEGNIVFQTLQEVDMRILLFINPDGEVFFFNFFFWFITTYLDIAVPVLVLILLILSFYVNALKKFQFVLFVVLIVFLVNGLATNLLKDLFGRARPQRFTIGMEFYFGDIHPLETQLGHTSFPSGHTSSSFSLMVPLIIYIKPKWLKASFLTYACCQGISRMWVGVHYPLDVLFGAILGTLIGLIFYYVIQTVINRTNPEDLRLD